MLLDVNAIIVKGSDLDKPCEPTPDPACAGEYGGGRFSPKELRLRPAGDVKNGDCLSPCISEPRRRGQRLENIDMRDGAQWHNTN